MDEGKDTMVTLSCLTCRVAFWDSELHKQHYKCDWHRYNLRRRVAEYPPVTLEDYERRFVVTKNEDDIMQKCRCSTCKKNFQSKKQYENHMISAKHKEMALRMNKDASLELVQDAPMTEEVGKSSLSDAVGTEETSLAAESSTNNMDVDSKSADSDVESVDSDEWIEDSENPVMNNDCLFCDHHSRSWVRNLKHMKEAHSFFLPDPEYCTDIKGMLVYLGEKIFAGYRCIWCNDTGRKFRNAEAARAHMIDKGHCKVLHEGEALMEYADFYDYSSSYPDGDTADPDAEVEIPEIDDSNFQLVLPSGSVIGHRSLMRYYKQNLNPATHAVALPKREKIRKVLCMYRALGGTGTQIEAAKVKARDIKYMQRIRTKYSTKLNFKANKLQTHFRQQVNF